MRRLSERTVRLRAPGPWLFKHAWLDHTRDKYAECPSRDINLLNYAEAWRRNGVKMREQWEAFMKSILCPSPDVVSPAWTALQLLLERQHDLRWLWIKPGGYFFTKAGNRRKVIRTKLIPRIITVTLRDRLAHAERIYYESLKSEVFGLSAITVMTLALAGSITGGDEFLASTPSIKRNQLRRRKRKFRLWAHSRTNNLRYLCRIGFLQQPRDDDPRI